MVSFFKKLVNHFWKKSTSIKHQPLNKVSLIILIIIDFFVLGNVLTGLSSISQWSLTPQETFPCYEEYSNYQTSEKKRTAPFDLQTIETVLGSRNFTETETYNYPERLGKVSSLCHPHSQAKLALNNSENYKLFNELNQVRSTNNTLQSKISSLKQQYDSLLLEKIAKQSRNKSINQTTADTIKEDITKNQQKITENQQKINTLESQLTNSQTSSAYLKLLQDSSTYQTISQSYNSAEFWYPNKQLGFQVLFLTPLIVVSYLIYSNGLKKDKGLQVLLSWHLLVIFSSIVLVKIFSYLQFGNLVAFVIDALVAFFGGVLFIASYSLIIVIPLLGFGLIKGLQTFIFNPKIQARNRVQKLRCIQCNSQLHLLDEYCPHCGFHQYIECPSCHQKTYQFTDYCRVCGETIDTKDAQ